MVQVFSGGVGFVSVVWRIGWGLRPTFQWVRVQRSPSYVGGVESSRLV